MDKQVQKEILADTFSPEFGADAGQQASAKGPPPALKELNRVGNMFMNGVLISTLRCLLDPTSYAVQPPPGLPDWAATEYKQRYILKQFTSTMMRDAFVFTGSMYAWDVTERTLKSVRGVDDPWNRVTGGVVSGLLLGTFWVKAGTPVKIASFAGAAGLLGYYAWNGEQKVKANLLAQQQQLEKELLNKTDAELKTTPDAAYLQQLVLMKQKAMADLWNSKVSEKSSPGTPGQTQSTDSGISSLPTVTASSTSDVAEGGWTQEPTLVINENEQTDGASQDAWDQSPTEPVVVEQKKKRWF